MQEVNKQEQELDHKQVNNKKISFNKKIVFKVVYSFLIFILLISVTRIPYVGQTIDSFIFEFCFGYAKYILYIYLFIFLIAKLFSLKFKPIFSKRMALFSLLSTCFASLLLAGLNISVFPENAQSFNFYIQEIFYGQMLDYSKYFIFGFTNYIDGGFIGAVLSSISGVFMVILAVLLVIITYFVLFINHWRKLKSKLFKKKNKTKDHELVEKQTFNLNDTTSTNTKNINGESYKSWSVSESMRDNGFMLSKTKQENINAINQYESKEINKKNIYIEFNEFLKEYNINIKKTKMTENDETFNILIDLDDDSIDKFNKCKEALHSKFSNTKFSFAITGSNVLIKFQKRQKIVNEILYQYLSHHIKNEGEFNICLDKQYQPIKFNFFNNSVMAISSSSNELLYGYLNSFIMHLGLNYKSEFMKVYYLNPIRNNYEILNLDIGVSKKIFELKEIKQFFNIIKQEAAELKKEFQKCGVNDIYELNKEHCRTYKNRIIIFNNIDAIYSTDKNFFIELTNIAKSIYKYGITIIFIDNSKEAKTFQEFNYGLILGIGIDKKTEKEITDKSSTRTIKNQAVLYNTDNKDKSIVLIPSISPAEITYINSINKNKLSN